MTIVQYIRERYPIDNRIEQYGQNPVARVEKEDGLPYDFIGPDEAGNMVKQVYVNQEGRSISVVDLIALSDYDLECDAELKQAYDVYMEQVTIEPVDFMDIMKSARQYKKALADSEEKADVLSL